MSSRRPLTPGKAALLMIGLGTVALMGVPGIGPAPGPRGALEGVLVDDRGFGLREGSLALFDADDLSLVEITHTDSRGRFAFQVVPSNYHVFARPPAESLLVADWDLDRRAGSGGLEFALRRGEPLTVSVLDQAGEPVQGAAVRMYDAKKEPSVLVELRTDEHGECLLRAPSRVHLAAFAPEGELGQRYRLDLDVPEGGARTVLHFPESDPVRGRVSDPRGPLSGIVVSAWSQQGALWEGYDLTDAEGAFELVGPRGEALELYVVDPENRHTPLLRTVNEPTAELSFLMAEVRRTEVVAQDARGAALPARIWVWSPVNGQWSWGLPTDAAGRALTLVPDGAAAYADPLHGGAAPFEAWDLQAGEASVVLRSGPAN